MKKKAEQRGFLPSAGAARPPPCIAGFRHMAQDFRFALPDEKRLFVRRLIPSTKDSVMATGQTIPRPADGRDPSGDRQTKLFRKIGISAVAAALEAGKPAGNRKDAAVGFKDQAH